MNRLEFSKVIGKGGQTISNIRTTCGAQVKGTDIDAENRLVVVTGTLRQVLEAFEMITDLMHAAYCQTVPSEHFSVQMLLEHSKVITVFTPKVLHGKSLLNALEQIVLDTPRLAVWWAKRVQ
jgi:rRNA processing protein Krr1/Pno1